MHMESRAGQHIRVSSTTRTIVHVTFKSKPAQPMLVRLRGLGKWSWKKRHWSIGGTVKHLTCFFEALADYLDLLALEGPVWLHDCIGAETRWES